jgi:hypothetical protein
MSVYILFLFSPSIVMQDKAWLDLWKKLEYTHWILLLHLKCKVWIHELPQYCITYETAIYSDCKKKMLPLNVVNQFIHTFRRNWWWQSYWNISSGYYFLTLFCRYNLSVFFKNHQKQFHTHSILTTYFPKTQLICYALIYFPVFRLVIFH